MVRVHSCKNRSTILNTNRYVLLDDYKKLERERDEALAQAATERELHDKCIKKLDQAMDEMERMSEE